MKKSATASAPGKVMFGIGHAVVYGYPTISSAVDARITVKVALNGTDVFQVHAPDLGQHLYTKSVHDLGKRQAPKSVRFIENLYKRFLDQYPQDRGIDVYTKSDFSHLYGLGSSSAVTVAFAKALLSLYNIHFTNEELFQLCYQAVLDSQGVGSGYDLATAIWGGTIKYVKPAKVIAPITLQDTPFFLVNSGIKADTPTLVRMIEEEKKSNGKKMESIFKKIGELSEDLYAALTLSDWQKVGACFNRSQKLAHELGVGVGVVDKIVQEVKELGAIGATITGAGGGDMVLAVADPSKLKEVKEKVSSNYDLIPVNFDEQGVREER